MSRVLLGRPTRSVGVVAIALALLCWVGPAVGKSSAKRGCAYSNKPVWRASSGELRRAVVCLINQARMRRGLPALYEQRQLDGAAQGHTNQMVGDDFFSHLGISSPGVRISAAGFDWGAYGETIATGFRSPSSAVHGWLASVEHCQILLSPSYRYIGIGVTRRGVAGFTNGSGTWTADLALPAGEAAPSRNWGPASGCPH